MKASSGIFSNRCMSNWITTYRRMNIDQIHVDQETQQKPDTLHFIEEKVGNTLEFSGRQDNEWNTSGSCCKINNF